MPIASLQDESGDIFEVFFHMDEMPPFGAPFALNGKTFTRLVDPPQRAIVQTLEFKGWSQPPWAKGAEAYDKDGTPCFSSKKAVQKYLDTQNKLADKDGVGEQGGEYLGYGGKTAL